MKLESGAYLNSLELDRELVLRPGLIPVDIDPVDGRIGWADLGQYHCYDGSFQENLRTCVSISRSPLDRFTSDFETLHSLRIPADSLAPSAFIFHAGRCGSTLLAQVLARSRAHMVFGEAAPHNNFWLAADRAPLAAEKAASAYRKLFLAMGRKRLDSYCTHVVKFTSFNVLRFEQVRAAFPGVPSLFLFREPGAILDSYRRANPSWMGRDVALGEIFTQPEDAVQRFFLKALSIRDANFRCLDYSALTLPALSSILQFFHLDPSPGDLSLMADGFTWDAKGGRTPRLFAPHPHMSETGGRRSAVQERLEELYRRLTTWRPLVDGTTALGRALRS